MITSPTCEVCGADDWHPHGTRTYRRPENPATTTYIARRLAVLFETWFPGHDEVTLEAITCHRCAFTCYRPRTEPTDIDAKYAKLHDLGSTYSDGHTVVSPAEQQRSRSLWEFLTEHVDPTPLATALDFGGGDGRLMHAFVRHGITASLLDYNPHAVHGVTRLGSTLDELDPSQPFDLILASHVLEHVAEPRSVVTRLASHLTDDGYLYIEVPLEIWDQNPLPAEPVTHINYFTPNSLTNLLGLCGLDPGVVTVGHYPHPTGGTKPAIRAIAAKFPPTVQPPQWKLLPLDDLPIFRGVGR